VSARRQFRTLLSAHEFWGEMVYERAGANGRATVWRVVAPIVGCGLPY